MLLSVLVALKSESSSPILGSLGRSTQAWLLNQITCLNPGLAKTLHDDNALKPYTVSTLLNDRGQPVQIGNWLGMGEQYWLRFTFFDEILSDLILQKLLPKLPERLTMYKMNFRIDGYTLSPSEHPWASQATYSDLAQFAGYKISNRRIRLEFTSPTAFRSGGNDIPLPIPGHIFRSIWQKWNAFAPEIMHVQDIWPSFAGDCIVVSEMTAVNTQRWTFAEGTRGAATGFTGTVGFTLLPKSKIPQNWIPYWDGASLVMQSLGQFAFYCGVGHHATIGMGQVRLVSMGS